MASDSTPSATRVLEAERFLARLAAQSGIASESLEQVLYESGTRLGVWRLIRQIGRGGMGVVYLAERADQQFAKQVALKMLPMGLMTPEARQRFQSEREILAQLEHPNIARLLDGGVTDEGTPYYAMEFVDGPNLTDWAQAQNPGLQARLAMFLKVCDAVAYAHRNLVIHRDIKPANILVGQDGEPKLLDFGIAKLTQSEPGDEVATTVLSERRLTLCYAAPELLSGESATTGCDVYALGVVLYELLAGRLPFEGQVTSDPAWRGRAANTRPQPPSARTGNPARAKRLRGDLDHIVLMAMHRDPPRRYATVHALMADLGRYRKQMPVLAAPDSARYRMGRFLKRHAVGAGVAAAVFLALAAVTGLALWQAHERDQAARRAVAVKDFLVQLFEAANPDKTLGEEVTVEALFARGVEKIRTELGQAPEAKAELLLVMGNVAHGLDRPRQGLELANESLALREALYGADSLEAADALREKGIFHSRLDQFDQARDALQRAAGIFRERLGVPSLKLAQVLRWLGSVELWAGRLDAAASDYTAALSVLSEGGEESQQERGIILSQLGATRAYQGHVEEAGKALREGITLLESVLGPDHYETLTTKNQYAIVLLQQGDYGPAEALMQEALAGFKNIYGPQTPNVMTLRANLASVQIKQGHFDAAAKTLRQVVAFWEGRHEADGLAALYAQRNLGRALRGQQRLEEAEAVYLRARERALAAPGERDLLVAAINSELAQIAVVRKDFAKAGRLARSAYDTRRKRYEAGHPELAASLVQLAHIARRRGDLDAARDYLTRAYELRLELFGPEHAETIEARSALEALNDPRAGDAAPRATEADS